MATLSSWPNPEALSQCFTLVRWLHANGISWSGTAAELTAQLREQPDSTLWFSDSEELVAFLETNEDMLLQLGLQSSVRKIAGRPRLIELYIVEVEAAPQKSGPVEVVSQLSAYESKIEEQPAAEEEEYKPIFAAEPVEVDQSSASEPVSRLYTLLGLPAEEAAVAAPAATRAAEKQSYFSGFQNSGDEETSLRRYLPLLIVILVTVALAALMVVMLRHRGATNTSFSVIEPNAATEPETQVQLDPTEVKKAKALLQQASTSRAASAQYDLALRYRDGRGVEKDYANALVWLNLAGANGETRAQTQIRELSPMVSPADAQQARIAIGKAFAAGVIVPRSLIIAHNWFSVAELAGSSEATALRKQVESKMSAGQLQRAHSTGR
jgi:TPR repeat protein